jgi:hypothetical protein
MVFQIRDSLVKCSIFIENEVIDCNHNAVNVNENLNLSLKHYKETIIIL